MISFTPPIKTSLLITLVYMICFQLYVQSGNYAWLYPGNVFFVICAVMYMRFLNRKDKMVNMLTLTAKGTQLSFTSSLLSFAGAAVIFLVNSNLMADTAMIHLNSGTINGAMLMIFANAFLINFVSGSLSAFITAGLMNERNYTMNSKHLSSIK